MLDSVNLASSSCSAKTMHWLLGADIYSNFQAQIVMLQSIYKACIMRLRH